MLHHKCSAFLQDNSRVFLYCWFLFFFFLLVLAATFRVPGREQPAPARFVSNASCSEASSPSLSAHPELSVTNRLEEWGESDVLPTVQAAG